jgi:hypothetical protein
MDEFGQRLADNVGSVRARVAAACGRAGRDPGTVTLVAITKSVDAAIAGRLPALGCGDLGESRPQELWDKSAALAPLPIRWHLVGPLQRNKIRRTLPLVRLIHSVDSIRLAEAIARIAAELTLPVDILLEVNVSGEANKQGLSPDAVEAALVGMAALPAIRIRGFMCMSGLHSDLQRKSVEFAALRELRDRVRRVAPCGDELNELSMGMSDDFELAIAEGATLIRVGTVLFSGLSRANR